MDIKEIQKALLEDYIVVSNICKAHNLKLFLTGGSVLGAVRHNGFIPWDDDMDLALPREQYEEFINNYSKELPDYLNVIIKVRNRHAAIIDNRYKASFRKEAAAFVDGENEYLSMDLQALDGTPNNAIFRFLHSTKVMINRVCYKMCDSSYIYLDNWRKPWERILIRMLKRFEYLFNKPEKYCKRWEESMCKYPYEHSDIIADYMGKYKYKDIYPKDWWEPGIMHNFEGIGVLIPSKYDKYLSQIYGEYMKIPTDEEKFIHIDLNEK